MLLTAALSPEAGRVFAGRYRLERLLAKGGMGSVWVARQLQLDVEVAVKFIAAEHASNPEARARFEREAKAAAQLRTTHVVHVYDHGVDEGVPYLVMELLEGEDLGERLKREGRLSLEAASAIAEQIARGLARAHAAGIVHRDLKPANIFLARSGEDAETVKLLDFGIAKAIGGTFGDAGEVTQTGTLLGSPFYMSPEQVAGRPLDHRSDLWSFAVILFRCVTGHRPFDANAIGEVLVRICTAEAPKPSALAPHLPADLDAFFERALARDPDRRYQSARDLAAAFVRIAVGASILGSGSFPSLRIDEALQIEAIAALTDAEPPFGSRAGQAAPASPAAEAPPGPDAAVTRTLHAPGSGDAAATSRRLPKGRMAAAAILASLAGLAALAAPAWLRRASPDENAPPAGRPATELPAEVSAERPVGVASAKAEPSTPSPEATDRPAALEAPEAPEDAPKDAPENATDGVGGGRDDAPAPAVSGEAPSAGALAATPSASPGRGSSAPKAKALPKRKRPKPSKPDEPSWGF